MNWVALALPLISGFAMNQLCPIPRVEPTVAQPPPIAFTIVWIALYTAIGYAWYRTRRISREADLWFALIIGALCTWQFLYGCGRRQREAFWWLAFTAVLVLVASLWFNNVDRVASVLLATLFGWLSFATLLSNNNLH